MAIGIKISKTAVFEIKYHVTNIADLTDKYGNNWYYQYGEMPVEYDDFYVMGVGLEILPLPTHQDWVEDKYFGYALPVYLEDDESDKPTWNRVLNTSTGRFSVPCTEITDDDDDDVDLYAKWSQFAWRLRDKQDLGRVHWMNAEVVAGAELYSWGGGSPTPPPTPAGAYARLPFKWIGVTQKEHSGAQNAIDFGWHEFSREAYYAPCDIVSLGCATTSGVYDHVRWRSQNKVQTPSGEKYIYFMVGHDDNCSADYRPAGTTLSRGAVMGYMGTKGLSSGSHCHMSGYVSDTASNNYDYNHGQHLYNVFYIDTSFSTVIDDGGYSWARR